MITDDQIRRVRASYNAAIAAHAESNRRWRDHARVVEHEYSTSPATEQDIADALSVPRQSVSKWVQKARWPPAATPARPRSA